METEIVGSFFERVWKWPLGDGFPYTLKRIKGKINTRKITTIYFKTIIG